MPTEFARPGSRNSDKNLSLMVYFGNGTKRTGPNIETKVRSFAPMSELARRGNLKLMDRKR